MSLSDDEISRELAALRRRRIEDDNRIAFLEEAIRDRRVRRRAPAIVFEDRSNEIVRGAAFFRGSLRNSIENLPNLSVDEFRQRYYHTLLQFLTTSLLERRSMKVIMSFDCNFHRIVGEVYTEVTARFWSCDENNAVAVNHPSEIPALINLYIDRLVVRIDEYTSMGSGWILDGIFQCNINIYRVNPMSGRSYIPLTQKLIDKKACVNIKNEDNNCFLWCILAFKGILVDKKHIPHPENPQSYSQVNVEEFNFDLTGIKSPRQH